MVERSSQGEWTSAEKATGYLERAESTPRRAEGERVLLDLIPPDAGRILDPGDGRLLALLKVERPYLAGVTLDFSPTMLQAAARRRLEGGPSVRVVNHDLSEPLPDLLGPFDAVVSCFAIHHCEDERKRALYSEVYALLEQGGVFCNLGIVSSPTRRLRERFLTALGYGADREGSGQLLDVGYAARLAPGDRLPRRGLSLEVARDGATRRSETGELRERAVMKRRRRA